MVTFQLFPRNRGFHLKSPKREEKIYQLFNYSENMNSKTVQLSPLTHSFPLSRGNRDFADRCFATRFERRASKTPSVLFKEVAQHRDALGDGADVSKPAKRCLFSGSGIEQAFNRRQNVLKPNPLWKFVSAYRRNLGTKIIFMTRFSWQFCSSFS